MSEDGAPFKVYQYIDDGAGTEPIQECVRTGVGAEEAVKAAHTYTHNVAATVLKITTRVIITDCDDNIAFEWKQGEGVTFPEEMKGRM